MLKQSTARNLMIFMTSSTDHVTGLTGATLAVSISKDGAGFASISPTVTERGNGWYNVALTTAHTDTLGDLVLRATASGADPTDLREQVFAALPGDAVTVDSIGANVITAASIAADAVTEIQSGLATSSVLASVKAQTDLIPASPAAVGDAMALTAGAISAVQSGLATSGDLTAVKAKTDSLNFTVAGQVDSNIQYVNDVQVKGTGAAGNEWGPV